MQITPGHISDSLNAQAESVVRDLLPNGKKAGHEWCAGSTSGEAGQSLKVCISGDKVGVWQDFASELIRGVDLKAALDGACAFLGIRRPEFAGAKAKTYKRPSRPKGITSASSFEPADAFLESRGITPETIKAYKVAGGVCGRPLGDKFVDTDFVIFPYMRDGELIHIKYRGVEPDENGKKAFWTSGGTEKCLFGWQVIPPTARNVVITEGELDAMTMYQYGFPALSVPFGGGKARKQDWIETEFEHLERFDAIYLCMDNDEEGAIAAAEIIDRLGRHRCRLVSLPHKDANECLAQGVTQAVIKTARKTSKTLDPSELRNASAYTEDVVKRFGPQNEAMKGFLLPWNSAAGVFTFEWGATTIISGQAGHGKSEIVGQIVIDAAQQKVRSCVASLEFKPDKWLARVVRQMTCNPFASEDQVRAAMHWLEPSLWAFEVNGRGAGTAKVDKLLDVFAYARARYGVRLFVIDNLSKCGIPEDDYSAQKQAISDITEFAVEHDVHIIVVAHQRKTDDEFSRSGKQGIKGSSAYGDLADNVWIIWRNRKKEFELKQLSAVNLDELSGEERTAHFEEVAKWEGKGDSYFTCEKYRSGDEEPYLKLFFDHRSHQFLTDKTHMPRTYV